MSLGFAIKLLKTYHESPRETAFVFRETNYQLLTIGFYPNEVSLSPPSFP